MTIDPARNPAVWDTLTWDAASCARVLVSRPPGFWESAHAALHDRRPAPASAALVLHDSSAGHFRGTSFILAELGDGQHCLVHFGKDPGRALGAAPFSRVVLRDGTTVSFHEVDSARLHTACSLADPGKLPQALPMVPRLGIGTRMSKAVWPGIWQALGECSFSANVIQNSQRELNLLESIRERGVPRKLYYPGIGFVPEGHTGSTFEGLWLCGVTEAVKKGIRRYGADADHIMVKRGTGGLESARKVLRAARYYSFYTIDVSDILDYAAFPAAGSGEGPAEALGRLVEDTDARKDVLAYYREPLKAGGRTVSGHELAGAMGKYWHALEALSSLAPFIAELRGNEPFDLELSIDEHPPEIHPFDCLTTEAEVAFLLRECRRRRLPLTHLAPNLGVEKHVDYRHPGGLEGLETRTRALHDLVSEKGVILDCHSGDDLSAEARRALKRATSGAIHFKISPFLQTLFADVLYELDRRAFTLWWDDTLDFARENAREGSSLAAECLRAWEAEPGAAPHPKHDLFRLFCFATVGKRDAEGSFLHREMFYSLPPEFSAEYARRVRRYLCTLANDLV